jgi:SHAQKYF class myb-like DNA-binding protein
MQNSSTSGYVQPNLLASLGITNNNSQQPQQPQMTQYFSQQQQYIQGPSQQQQLYYPSPQHQQQHLQQTMNYHMSQAPQQQSYNVQNSQQYPQQQQQQQQHLGQTTTTTITSSSNSYTDDVLQLVIEQHKRILQLEQELDQAKTYIQRLQDYASKLEDEKNPKKKQSRYWTQKEHQMFLEAIQLYGRKDVKSIAAYVGTRTPTQVRTHSQKYYAKLEQKPLKRGEEDDDDILYTNDSPKDDVPTMQQNTPSLQGALSQQ